MYALHKYFFIRYVVISTALLAACPAFAGTWFDCDPARAAARAGGEMHIGCKNIPGWYFVKAGSNSKEYIDRVLYMATTAIATGKSLKLETATPGKDSEILAIEIFK